MNGLNINQISDAQVALAKLAETNEKLNALSSSDYVHVEFGERHNREKSHVHAKDQGNDGFHVLHQAITDFLNYRKQELITLLNSYGINISE